MQSSHLRCSAHWHWQRHALEPDVRCRRRARQRGARATCGLARRPLAARSDQFGREALLPALTERAVLGARGAWGRAVSSDSLWFAPLVRLRRARLSRGKCVSPSRQKTIARRTCPASRLSSSARYKSRATKGVARARCADLPHGGTCASASGRLRQSTSYFY